MSNQKRTRDVNEDENQLVKRSRIDNDVVQALGSRLSNSQSEDLQPINKNVAVILDEPCISFDTQPCTVDDVVTTRRSLVRQSDLSVIRATKISQSFEPNRSKS